MNLYNIFARRIARHPGATALIDARTNRRWSYLELDMACAQAAKQLRESGLKQGDAVLLFLPMSAALYISLLACFRLGLVVLISDPRAGRKHLNRCCRLYPPRAFIGTPKAHLLRLFVSEIRSIPHKFTTGRPLPGATQISLEAGRNSDIDIVSVKHDCPALISFTSGSTGTPKAAVRSHGFLLAQHKAISQNLSADAGTINLNLFPVFVLSNLAAGVTSILADVDLRRPDNIDAAALIKAIDRYQPDSLGAPPAALTLLVNYCNQQNLQLSRPATFYTGGSPVFATLLKNLKSIAPHSRIISVYGSTEAEPIALSASDSCASCYDGEQNRGKGLLAGIPVPEINLRIIKDVGKAAISSMHTPAFEAMCLDRDQTGEIVVSGEHVLKTYLNGNGDSENKFRVDDTVWHRTGDAGSLDNEGRLWLAGRCHARIEDSEGITYPLAIEAAVQNIRHVKQAALISINDKRVLVVACRRIYRHAVKLAFRTQLVWAGIDSLRFLSKIPVDRRHNGKIDYSCLYKKLSG